MLEVALYCFVVSLLWGATNPLIKKSTVNIVRVEAKNPVRKFFGELRYLIANWRYVILFLINQLGSVLYFVLLQHLDLSLIVPTVNSLNFIITSIFGLLIGESAPNSREFLGIILILIGTTFCVLDKVDTTAGKR